MNKVLRPTMRDIAEASGYSLGTVSQALNRKPGVSSHTRARVFEVAQQMGYPVQRDEDNGPRGNLATVGLLVKQDEGVPNGLNPFYSNVLAGAELECQRHGFTLAFASVGVDHYNRVPQWPALLFDRNLDGLLVVGTFLEGTIAQITEQTRAIVLVDAYAPALNVDSVVTDNLNGAQNAVNYLISQGHTHIGLIGSTPDAYPSIRERRKGYSRALKQAGITAEYIEDGLLTREAGRAATHRLLTRTPQISAIFSCNDEVAIGVMEAAQDLGLRVPDDLSLMGFDDIAPAELLRPALTTMHVDKPLMGALAVRHLIDKFENPDRPNYTTMIGTRLVIRDSVRAPG